MTLEMDQMIRMQVEIMNGRTWECHSDEVPDSDEAHQMWDKIAADSAAGEAKGWAADIPNELAI